MQCFVYRSTRNAQTYVYLRERDAFELLPPALLAQLGTLIAVMQLDLSPPRKLGREDIESVRRNLQDTGFHLQLPPPIET